MKTQRNILLIGFLVLSIIVSFHLNCAGPKKQSETGSTPAAEEAIPISPEAEEDYQKAVELFEAGKFARARKPLKHALKKTQHPGQREKILFLMAESLFHIKKCRKYDKAYAAYQKYLIAFPQTKRLDKVVEREFEIGAAFLSGRAKKKFLGIFRISAPDTGLKIIRDTLKKYPYTASSSKYQMALADFYYEKRRYENARVEYEYFIQTYRESKGASRAEFLLAECYLKEYQGPEYDMEPLVRAKSQFQRVVERYPESEMAEKAKIKLKEIVFYQAQREYKVGLFYLKTGKPESARIYFQSIINEYPETQWAKKAQEKLKKSER